MDKVNQIMLESVDHADGLRGVFALRCGFGDWIRIPISLDEVPDDGDGRAALWSAFYKRFPDFPVWDPRAR